MQELLSSVALFITQHFILNTPTIMVEYDRSQSPKAPADKSPRICIVGVGGAGSNVVDRITLDRIVDATLICMHTDVRVLGHSMAPVKVQLGAS
jgi:cell division protein FtsZ